MKQLITKKRSYKDLKKEESNKRRYVERKIRPTHIKKEYHAT
jgi:hypothetical protein